MVYTLQIWSQPQDRIWGERPERTEELALPLEAMFWNVAARFNDPSISVVRVRQDGPSEDYRRWPSENVLIDLARVGCTLETQHPPYDQYPGSKYLHVLRNTTVSGLERKLIFLAGLMTGQGLVKSGRWGGNAERNLDEELDYAMQQTLFRSVASVDRYDGARGKETDIPLWIPKLLGARALDFMIPAGMPFWFGGEGHCTVLADIPLSAA